MNKRQQYAIQAFLRFNMEIWDLHCLTAKYIVLSINEFSMHFYIIYISS